MVAAVADLIEISYIVESAWKTTPNVNSQALRLRSESLKLDKTTVQSQEIGQGRRVIDLVTTEESSSGGIEGEFSHTTYDKLLEAAFYADATFAGTSTIGPLTTISFETIATSSTSNAKILDSANGLGGLTQYSWLKVSGSTTSDGVYKILSVAAGEIEVNKDFSVDEAAGDSVTLKQGNSITDGDTERSLTLQKHYTDLAGNKYIHYPGSIPETLSLSVTPGEIALVSFSFRGAKPTASASGIGTGTVDAATTTKVYSSVANVTLIQGGLAEAAATEVSYETSNNLRARQVISGGTGPHSIAAGKFDATGSFRTLYEDDSVFTLWENDTDDSLAIVYEDTAGNVYVVDNPRIRYTDGERVAGGENTDIIADMSYRALKHATEGITTRLVSIPA